MSGRNRFQNRGGMLFFIARIIASNMLYLKLLRFIYAYLQAS